jgi:predicted nucleic acid-binding protein
VTGIILLDTGVLGMIVHPSTDGEAGTCKRWMVQQLRNGQAFALPEICDYELRRKLLHMGAAKQIGRLDELGLRLSYLPITTQTMRQAAMLWSIARREGMPTAGPRALDADAVLGAQAVIAAEGGPSVIVATTNVRHLQRFATAARWGTIG